MTTVATSSAASVRPGSQPRNVSSPIGSGRRWQTDVKRTDRIVVGSRTFKGASVLGRGSYEVSRRVVAVELS